MTTTLTDQAGPSAEAIPSSVRYVKNGRARGQWWRCAKQNGQIHAGWSEIPANLVFKTGSSGYTRFFAGAGPYLGVGIAGKVKSDGKVLGSSFTSEKNIEWSNDDPSTLNYEESAGFGIMKRFDYGLNGTAGIETRSAVISVNYGFGLARLQSGSKNSADDKNKHRVLSFTVGVRL